MKNEEDHLYMVMQSYYSQYNSMMQYCYALYDIKDVKEHLNILTFETTPNKFVELGECLKPYHKNITFAGGYDVPKDDLLAYLSIIQNVKAFRINEEFSMISFVNHVSSVIYDAEDTTYASGEYVIDIMGIDEYGDVYEAASFRFDNPEDVEEFYNAIEITFP